MEPLETKTESHEQLYDDSLDYPHFSSALRQLSLLVFSLEKIVSGLNSSSTEIIDHTNDLSDTVFELNARVQSLESETSNQMLNYKLLKERVSLLEKVYSESSRK